MGGRREVGWRGKMSIYMRQEEATGEDNMSIVVKVKKDS